MHELSSGVLLCGIFWFYTIPSITASTLPQSGFSTNIKKRQFCQKKQKLRGTLKKICPISKYWTTIYSYSKFQLSHIRFGMPVLCHQGAKCSCWAVWSAWLADYVQEDIWHESWPIHMYFFTVITTASNVSVTRVLKDARSCEKKKPKGLCPGGNLGSVLLPLSLVCHEQSLLIPKTRF